MSSREVQLGRAVANNRVEVAIEAAELQEIATLKATELNAASMSDCMDRQLSVQ
jgi:ribosomal protein L11